MKKGWIGVDPGATGAIVILTEGEPMRTLRFMNSTNKETHKFLNDIAFEYDQVFCILEAVHAMPGMAAGAMFNFGESYGFIQGVLVSTGIPYELVTPQSWMKHMRIPKRDIQRDPVTKKELPGSESKTDYKRRLKQKAEELYPTIKITNDTADAILIADYCKRLKTNTL